MHLHWTDHRLHVCPYLPILLTLGSTYASDVAKSDKRCRVLAMFAMTQTPSSLCTRPRRFVQTSMSCDLSKWDVPSLGFGVEIEFDEIANKSSDDIVQSFREDGLDVKFNTYKEHSNISWDQKESLGWSLTTDSTAFWEIVSPILTSVDGLIEVKKVCESLERIGATCSKDCGFHVHVDGSALNDVTRADLFIFYDSLEQEHALLDCVEAGRAESKYCKRALRKIVHQARSTGQISLDDIRPQGRYRALNFITKHGSVEFRRYHGTLCVREVLSWIILCLILVSKPTPILGNGSSLSHVFANLGMLASENLPQWAASVLLERKDFADKLRFLKEIGWVERVLLEKPSEDSLQEGSSYHSKTHVNPMQRISNESKMSLRRNDVARFVNGEQEFAEFIEKDRNRSSLEEVRLHRWKKFLSRAEDFELGLEPSEAPLDAVIAQLQTKSENDLQAFLQERQHEVAKARWTLQEIEANMSRVLRSDEIEITDREALQEAGRVAMRVFDDTRRVALKRVLRNPLCENVLHLARINGFQKRQIAQLLKSKGKGPILFEAYKDLFQTRGNYVGFLEQHDVVLKKAFAAALNAFGKAGRVRNRQVLESKKESWEGVLIKEVYLDLFKGRKKLIEFLWHRARAEAEDRNAMFASAERYLCKRLSAKSCELANSLKMYHNNRGKASRILYDLLEEDTALDQAALVEV